MSEDKRLSFSNNEALHEFVITIARDLETDSDTLLSDLDTKKPNLDTNSDTPQRLSLTNKQKDVLNFCTIPRGSKEILQRVGVSYHTKNIEKYINSLVDAGYLEMTNPESPNASNQKYRKAVKK